MKKIQNSWMKPKYFDPIYTGMFAQRSVPKLVQSFPFTRERKGPGSVSVWERLQIVPVQERSQNNVLPNTAVWLLFGTVPTVNALKRRERTHMGLILNGPFPCKRSLPCFNDGWLGKLSGMRRGRKPGFRKKWKFLTRKRIIEFVYLILYIWKIIK